MTGMIATLTFDTDRMADVAPDGHALATEIADWLVSRSVPFRSAHEIAGLCVQEAEARGVQLWDLDDDVLVGISPELDPSVREVLSVQERCRAGQRLGNLPGVGSGANRAPGSGNQQQSRMGSGVCDTSRSELAYCVPRAMPDANRFTPASMEFLGGSALEVARSC